MEINEAPLWALRTATHFRQPENYDRFFKPDRAMITMKGKTLIEVVKIAIEVLEAQRGARQRKRRPGVQRAFERALEAVVCDLVHMELTGYREGIAVPRSKQVLCKTSRYKPWFYGKQVTCVLDLMTDAGFITQDKGKWKPNKQGQRTLIRPDYRLLELIADLGLTLADIGTTSDGETIQLKDHNKSPLEYEDTEKTYQMRQQMENINEWIASADITFDQSCKSDGIYVDVTKRRLYRVFIHSSFNLHGRMYGGFWIGLPKAERLAGLSIDGQRVIGLDYGQAFPRIAYGRAGHDPPAGDLYSIPGLEAYREGIKKLMNAMLNHDKPFSRKPRKLKPLLPKDMNIHQLQEAIRNHHHPIAHLFGTNVGQQLTLIESEIMVTVLLQLKEQGVVALPIHDCIVVREDHEEIATKVMKQVFEDMVGVSAIITPEYGASEGEHQADDDGEYEVWSNDLCEAYV
jgi:hypothetical protein